ncbi:Uncharacterised protein [Mycobacteroides abscessus subsp. abscessus]|nr:Uncharacterised protein [Mycobacteroides abscessus subsp. abscessus]
MRRLDRGGGKPFRFVDDDELELGRWLTVAVADGVTDESEVFLDEDVRVA